MYYHALMANLIQGAQIISKIELLGIAEVRLPQLKPGYQLN